MTTAQDAAVPTATRRGRPPATTRKTSLYRLRGDRQSEDDPRAFVLPQYLDRHGFTSQVVDHAGIKGLLVTGTTAPGPPHGAVR